MIANNSSGARTPIYGTTVDHVRSLEIVTADGKITNVEPGNASLQEHAASVGSITADIRGEIDNRMPPGLLKHWPGYGFEPWFRKSADLKYILSGSEGTLAGFTSAVLQITPLPKSKSLGVLFFDTVTDALSATVDLLDLKPVAIEHIDKLLFDQTQGQIQFRRARALLELDDKRCGALLLIEFYDDDQPLDELMNRDIGIRRAAFRDSDDMNAIWGLRKAGLTLLTSCKGPAKPAAGIEDVAIMPDRLPAYVERLHALMASLQLEGSFYGHAASGLLHVRPVVDLHEESDIAKYRDLADGVLRTRDGIQRVDRGGARWSASRGRHIL